MIESANTQAAWRWNSWRIAAWSLAALLLLAPLVAMQFSDEVKWSPFDFLFASVLLIGTGLAFEFIVRKFRSPAYRAALAIALFASFLLVWINAAVGIIGEESNRANLMYAGVLAIGFLCAIFSRFKPLGMARALFAMAIAQTLVAIIAISAGFDTGSSAWPFDLIALTAIFVAMFVGSGVLFRKSTIV